MLRLVKNPRKNPITLRNHFNRRNKVLINRRTGGFGDILMQRMMFEDFSKTGLEITWATPYKFMGLTKNHPYTTTINISSAKNEEYGATFDITTACRVYESRLAPYCKKHRSDIWAEYCGVTLQNHNMFLTPLPEKIEECKKIVQEVNPERKPIVLLATTSHINNDEDVIGLTKSLTDNQVKQLVYDIRKLNLMPISVHDIHQNVYSELNVPQFTLPVQNWLALVSLADYIISVDTGTFHMAGGLKKPLVGIFTCTDGKVYGKYYDFILIQKHRDNGNWPCGPCFICNLCPKEKVSHRKPCLTELTVDEIIQGLQKALEKWPVIKSSEKIS